MKKLTISIVTWNSASTLEACLTSVFHQTFTDFQLIVVDNNSADQTCNIVTSFHDPRLQLLRLTENTGFCGGHNLAINNSQSEYVLLVNPDIIMNPDYVEKALATIQKDNRIGAVCGLLVQSDPADPNCIIDSAGLELLRSRTMRMCFHGVKKADSRFSETEVYGADGALPLYSRSMINDISMNHQFFDEMFFAHKEDWDISWRAHIYGWKTVFNPACIAIHPRQFKPLNLSVRNKMADHIKVHAVKNQLILLLKNETLGSFLSHTIFILPRQITIFMYILLFERTSLKAYRFVIGNYKTIMAKRRIIQRNRRLKHTNFFV